MSWSRAISAVCKLYVETDGEFGIPGAQLATVRESFPGQRRTTESAFFKPRAANFSPPPHLISPATPNSLAAKERRPNQSPCPGRSRVCCRKRWKAANCWFLSPSSKIQVPLPRCLNSLTNRTERSQITPRARRRPESEVVRARQILFGMRQIPYCAI